MKKILTTALALALSVGASQAQNTKEPRALMMTLDDTFKGWVVQATKRTITFRETENSTSYRELKLSATTVYFLEPEEFTEAMELYKSRNYSEARSKFGACAKIYKRMKSIPGNYSTLARFYEMECMRKLNDLTTLCNVFDDLPPELLLHEEHRMQLKIYGVFWDAVRTKSWERLAAIASDPNWRNLKVSGGLRAQMSYAHGLALEGMGQSVQALNAYNNAFVADFSASEEITRKSALSCLRLLSTHEDVKLAMKLYSTKDHNPDSNGMFLIKEGIALIKLWDKVLGKGTKLPGEYKIFNKFKPK